MKKKPEPDTIQSVDETGVAVQKRFVSSTAAFNIYKRIRSEDQEDARKRALIQGLIDGNRPYPVGDLKSKGQSWRSNVNYREAESIRDSNAAAYWSLLVEVAQLVTVKIRHTPEDIRAHDDEQVIAEEFTKLLFDWEGFFYNMMLHAGEMLTYGIGPVVWTDRFDWRFKAIPRGNFMVPPRTRSSIDKVQMFFMSDTISVHELLAAIEDPKLAKSLGWNVKEVKKVIIDRFNTQKLTNSEKYSKSTWENIQQQIKNNDLGADFDDADELKVVHAFIQNTKDTKISHYMFPEVEARAEYMLAEDGIYENMNQILNPFIYNVGDGWFRSIKGLGHRMYQAIELSNRLINATFDCAIMSGSIVVQSTGTKQDLRLMRVGPLTQLPDGVQPINQAFTPNISQILNSRSMLQNILNNNHGIYQKSNENSSSPARTRAEVIIAEQKETRLLNFQIMQYYVHLDRLYKEVWRRIMDTEYPESHPGYKEIRDFKKRCEEKGVDPIRWKKLEMITVKAMRTVGAGSPAIRQIVMDKFLQASSMMPPEGQLNVMRDWIAAYSSYESADRYAPIRSKAQAMTVEHSMAMLENNDLAEGAECMVTMDQNHEAHLDIHMPQLMELVSGVMKAIQAGKQIDPTKVLPYIQAAIPHVTQHLQIMAVDSRKKEKATTYTQMIGQATKIGNALMKMAQKQAQQQAQLAADNQATLEEAQLTAPSEDLKVKLAKVQAEARINMFAAEHKARMAEAKTMQAMQLKSMQARANIRIKMEQAGIPVEEGEMEV